MARVLIVDDEEPLRESLRYAFTREGHEVVTASDGASALQIVDLERLDVIVLDLMLPAVDGAEVCRRIRTHSDIPIVMLTARDQPSDTVAGLELGADDYVTKPFNTRELLARVAAVARRHASSQRLLAADRELLARMEEISERLSRELGATVGPNELPGEPQVPLGELVIYTGTGNVSVDGRRVELAPKEHAVLRLLSLHVNRVVTRTELIERLWGPSTPERLVLLEAVMRTLVQKIEKDPTRPRYIHAVPGIGFQLVQRRRREPGPSSPSRS